MTRLGLEAGHGHIACGFRFLSFVRLVGPDRFSESDGLAVCRSKRTPPELQSQGTQRIRYAREAQRSLGGVGSEAGVGVEDSGRKRRQVAAVRRMQTLQSDIKSRLDPGHLLLKCFDAVADVETLGDVVEAFGDHCGQPMGLILYLLFDRVESLVSCGRRVST